MKVADWIYDLLRSLIGSATLKFFDSRSLTYWTTYLFAIFFPIIHLVTLYLMQKHPFMQKTSTILQFFLLEKTTNNESRHLQRHTKPRDIFVDFTVSGIFLPSPLPPSQTTYLDPRHRLIALGDLHGDPSKTQQALRLAGLIDANDRWCGGSTLVQVGDVLDNGGQELKILYSLEKLKREAVKDGGSVITMNGNHEILNVDRKFCSVHVTGLEEFQNWAHSYTIGNNMKQLCGGLTPPKDIFDGIPLSFPGIKQEYLSGIRARLAALRPTAPIATRFLSKNLIVLVVSESVFAHGGISPEQLDYGLEHINNDVRDWMTGLKDNLSSDFVKARDTIVWLRKFSKISIEDCDCSKLEHALATIQAQEG